MSIERAGDRVFMNIDEALADKIISRSRVNSESAAPTADNAVNHRKNKRKATTAISIVMTTLTLLFLALLILKRKGGNDD